MSTSCLSANRQETSTRYRVVLIYFIRNRLILGVHEPAVCVADCAYRSKAPILAAVPLSRKSRHGDVFRLYARQYDVDTSLSCKPGSNFETCPRSIRPVSYPSCQHARSRRRRADAEPVAHCIRDRSKYYGGGRTDTRSGQVSCHPGRSCVRAAWEDLRRVRAG